MTSTLPPIEIWAVEGGDLRVDTLALLTYLHVVLTAFARELLAYAAYLRYRRDADGCDSHRGVAQCAGAENLNQYISQLISKTINMSL